MQERIFDPLGMKSTTFDYARALAGNHATPHGDDVDGKTERREHGDQLLDRAGAACGRRVDLGR